ncbi:hypothetical protein PHLH4_49510 [Pseudomonas sp. St316]|nr:hypothetical protein PHLH4_49510 [Pseudomonas sp. St316]
MRQVLVNHAPFQHQHVIAIGGMELTSKNEKSPMEVIHRAFVQKERRGQ